VKILPRISICVPTFNEEKNIRTALDAVYAQDYPADKIEVLVVDNRSTDHTVEIALGYGVRVLYNDIEKHGETSKMIGFRACTGELFIYLDADIEILGSSWLRDAVRPFLENERLAGSFGRFAPKPYDCAIGRFLRYHPLELDPVFQYFCTGIDKTVVEHKTGYELCRFTYPRIPPVGICLYRVDYLRQVLGDAPRFMDIDVPCLLSLAGYTGFAYVDSCRFYHINITSLRELLSRRWRNLTRIYLPNESTRVYRYFDLSSPLGLARITAWVIYANLFAPELLRGVINAFRYRDAACLYQPLISLTLTDMVCFGFLRNKFLAGLISGGSKNGGVHGPRRSSRTATRR
jgi:glycosyltransferase involved in cell wall biosynthesis